MADQNRYGQGIITWSIVIMRRENMYIVFCLFAGQVMFPRHIMRVGFSIREGIRGRAVENCPIVPTDLTFHRYWTISYNSTFTLLTEQHWWPYCNLVVILTFFGLFVFTKHRMWHIPARFFFRCHWKGLRIIQHRGVAPSQKPNQHFLEYFNPLHCIGKGYDFAYFHPKADSAAS